MTDMATTTKRKAKAAPAAAPSLEGVGSRPHEPIFAVGFARSGTTLLASLVGRHPMIASTPETHFLNEVQFMVAPSLPKGPEAVVDRLADTPLRRLELAREDVLPVIQRLWPLDLKGIFGAYLEVFRTQQGKPRVLEKTPNHLRHIDELLEWYPDAKVLWIIRDGRACVASMLKVKWGSNDPKVLAQQWMRNIAFGLEAEPRAGDRLLRVSYERLLSNPVEEMNRIQDFLSVPRSDMVHDHTVDVSTVSSFEQDWKANVFKPVMNTRAEAWREELTPEVQDEITAMMEPFLKTFGYDVSREGKASASPFLRFKRSVIYSPAGVRLLAKGYAVVKRFQNRA